MRWCVNNESPGKFSPEARTGRGALVGSAVERAGHNTLNEDAKVSYEEKENRGKMSAENLRVG